MIETVQAAAYVRVSSKGQDDRSQRSAIRRAAAARGDEVATWYAEKASGTTNERAELGRLREACRAGAVRRLYVFRVDRLTRTGAREALEIVEELRRHGCELVTIADGFDLQGPAAEIVLAVMAWAAKMERTALGERISAARVRVEAAGGDWGRPRRMNKELREKAADMKSKGKSVRFISAALKVPRSTVGDLLSEKPHQNGRALAAEKPGLKKAEPPSSG